MFKIIHLDAISMRSLHLKKTILLFVMRFFWSFSMCSVAYADDYSFDPSMLGEGIGANVDLSLLEHGGQLPGSYFVEIFLNDIKVDFREIDFSLKQNHNKQDVLQPCISRAQLLRYKVNVELYPALFSGKKESFFGGGCADFSAIPQATVEFDFINQQLFLAIPQIAMQPESRGIASPDLWDDGIPAIIMNYRMNTERTAFRRGGDTSSSSSFIQVEPGINLGAWRVRNSTSLNVSSDQPREWQTLYTYAELGLYDQKSRLTIGESQTPADIFESVPFFGVMLATDDAMVAYNQRAFSPVVRGIARSKARVEVTQNGFLVYSATVEPGAFELTDLVASSIGDLHVTIKELDGDEQEFVVPNSAPAISLKKGYLRYNLMMGSYRSANGIFTNTPLGQGTVMYGLPLNLTIFSGAQLSQRYQSVALGVGSSLGEFGAISFNGITSYAQRNGKAIERGQAWQVRYNKFFESTSSGFQLASYQHMSSNFNVLNEVLNEHTADSSEGDVFVGGERTGGQKARTTISLYQSLGNWGQISLNGSRETYWGQNKDVNSFGVSHSIVWHGIAFSSNWSQHRNLTPDGAPANDSLISFSASMPIDYGASSGSPAYATYQVNDAGNQTFGLSGNALDQTVSWGVRQTTGTSGSSDESSNTRSLLLGMRGTYGLMGVEYNYSPYLRQMGANSAGSIVLHEHGLTFGQPLGEAASLVEIPGISGVLTNRVGVKTDFNGYTTVGYLAPYQENIIGVKPETLPLDAELTETDIKVIPTYGALVRTNFSPHVGARILLTLDREGATSVPFGAIASFIGDDVATANVGVVDVNGEVYLSGAQESGAVLVRWGGGQCRAHYSLPEERSAGGIYVIKSQCY